MPGANPVPELRFLKLLVGGLAVVMGAGIIAVVALLWLRLSPATPGLPDGLVLPAGAEAEAVTFGKTWTVVVTKGGEVLVYDAAGRLRQQVPLTGG